MPVCPVCQEQQDADVTAFNHHVNAHFEGGAEGAEGARSGLKAHQGVIGAKVEPDHIEVLDDEVDCPICGYPLGAVSLPERETHVKACMDPDGSRRDADVDADADADSQAGEYDFAHPNGQADADESVQPEWDGPARPGGWTEWVSRKTERGDKWWDPVAGDVKDLPSNFSPGLVLVMEKMLETCVHQGATRSAVLSQDAVYIRGVWGFDMGWGCGYRNALMLLSALILFHPSYASLFSRESNGSDPSLRRVQGWLQEAWTGGWDPDGRLHFRGRVLGTRKWIGTSDLYTMFSYKGVPCALYDFPKPKTKSGRPAHAALQAWVKRYFSDEHSAVAEPVSEPKADGAQNQHRTAFDVLMRTQEGGDGRGTAVRRSHKLPLILQHSGHSRTIVGYEETARGDINLLLFDPGKKSVPTEIRNAGIDQLELQRQRNHLAAPSAPPLRTGNSTSSFSSASTRQSAAVSSSHESLSFSPPYHSGGDNFVSLPDQPVQRGAGAGGAGGAGWASGLKGGSTSVQLEEDEEMDEEGWVRKKAKKIAKKAKDKGRGVAGGIGSGAGSKPWEGQVSKGLGYFRVNLSAVIGSHAEYQILAFTGGPLLPESERIRRKIITSTVVR